MKSKEKQKKSISTSLHLVTEYGIPPDLIGCQYIAKAVELYSMKKCNFKNLYNTVADMFSTNHKSVRRCISYAISKAYNINEKLSDTFDITIPKSELHISLVIAYLSIIWSELL